MDATPFSIVKSVRLVDSRGIAVVRSLSGPSNSSAIVAVAIAGPETIARRSGQTLPSWRK
jgi:hypothetical protein